METIPAVEKRRSGDSPSPPSMPPNVHELVRAGKARWNERPPTLPEPIKLRGRGPLASDYVIEGRR
jgi:hypothetical protein